MLLIHLLASVFCFILLILNGVDAADIQDCIKGIQDLIDSTAHNWERLIKGLLIDSAEHFYFIPDDNLIKILASMPIPSNRSAGEISPVKVPDKKSRAIIQNHVNLGIETVDFMSANFVVKLGNKKGKAKFVCGGKLCRLRMSALDLSLYHSKKFPCLSENEMYLEPAELNGIAITFAGQKRVIFYADLILENLFPFKNFYKTAQWTATTAVIIKNRMITFNDKEKKSVATVPWPMVIADRTLYDTESVTMEYVQAAVKVVNTYKRGITLPTPYIQEDSGWILGILNI